MARANPQLAIQVCEKGLAIATSVRVQPLMASRETQAEGWALPLCKATLGAASLHHKQVVPALFLGDHSLALGV